MCILPQFLLFLSLLGTTTPPTTSPDCSKLLVQPVDTFKFVPANEVAPGTLVWRAKLVAVADGPLSETGESLKIEDSPTLAPEGHDLNRHIEYCGLKLSCGRMPHPCDDPPPLWLAGAVASQLPTNHAHKLGTPPNRTLKLGIHAILEKPYQSHRSIVGGFAYIPNAATHSSNADLLEFSIGPRFYLDRPSKRFRLFATTALLSTIQPDFGFGVYPAVGLRFNLDDRPLEIEMGYHDVKGSRLDSFTVQIRLAVGKRRSKPGHLQ